MPALQPGAISATASLYTIPGIIKAYEVNLEGLRAQMFATPCEGWNLDEAEGYLVWSIMLRPKAVTEAEISRQGILPITAPVNP